VVELMDEKVRQVMGEKDMRINDLEEEVRDLKALVDTGIMNQAAVITSPHKKVEDQPDTLQSTKPQSQKSS
jgi:hypothetical protein